MRRPNFLLKPSAYKSNKLYAILPDNGGGDMTPSSYAGNGTRVNKDGFIEAVASDTPRIDYQGGYPKLLLEPTRTNQNPDSEDLSGTGWSVSGTTVKTANDAVAPDGQYAATKVASNAGNSSAAVLTSTAVSDTSAIHTSSFFVHFGSCPSIDYSVYSSPTLNALVDITATPDGTQTVNTDTGSAYVDSGFERYINGWIRFWVAFDTDAAQANIVTRVDVRDFNNEQTGYCWLWGFQLEEGSFPTSYIPTASGTAQRLYDYMEVTGLSPTIIGLGSAAMLVDLDVTAGDPDSAGYLCTIGTSLGAIRMATNGTTPYYPKARITNPSTSEDYTLTTTRAKVLFNVFGDSTDVWVNGTKQTEDSVDMYLTASTLILTGQFTKWSLRELTLWDAPLNDTDAKSATQ